MSVSIGFKRGFRGFWGVSGNFLSTVSERFSSASGGFKEVSGCFRIVLGISRGFSVAPGDFMSVPCVFEKLLSRALFQRISGFPGGFNGVSEGFNV